MWSNSRMAIAAIVKPVFACPALGKTDELATYKFGWPKTQPFTSTTPFVGLSAIRVVPDGFRIGWTRVEKSLVESPSHGSTLICPSFNRWNSWEHNSTNDWIVVRSLPSIFQSTFGNGTPYLSFSSSSSVWLVEAWMGEAIEMRVKS